jgi:hypothetical protein
LPATDEKSPATSARFRATGLGLPVMVGALHATGDTLPVIPPWLPAINDALPAAPWFAAPGGVIGTSSRAA